MSVEPHWTRRDGRYLVRGSAEDVRVGRCAVVHRRNGSTVAVLIGRIISSELDTYHDEDVVLALPMREWQRNPCSRCGKTGGIHEWAGSSNEETVVLLCAPCREWAVRRAVIAEERDRPPLTEDEVSR